MVLLSGNRVPWRDNIQNWIGRQSICKQNKLELCSKTLKLHTLTNMDHRGTKCKWGKKDNHYLTKQLYGWNELLLSYNSPFIKPWGALPCSLEHVTGPYTTSDESSPKHGKSCFSSSFSWPKVQVLCVFSTYALSLSFFILMGWVSLLQNYVPYRPSFLISTIYLYDDILTKYTAPEVCCWVGRSFRIYSFFSMNEGSI